MENDKVENWEKMGRKEIGGGDGRGMKRDKDRVQWRAPLFDGCIARQ
jgi:hypothetical protein